jgi:hydroxypyruvate reductase
MFSAAAAAAKPSRRLAKYLPFPPNGRIVVVGAGKTSAAVAQAVEASWPDPLSGLLVIV